MPGARSLSSAGFLERMWKDGEEGGHRGGDNQLSYFIQFNQQLSSTSKPRECCVIYACQIKMWHCGLMFSTLVVGLAMRAQCREWSPV